MTDSPSQPDNQPEDLELLESLTAAIVEGTLSESQRDQLARLLKDNPAAQAFYRDYLEIHTLLAWEHGSMGATPLLPQTSAA